MRTLNRISMVAALTGALLLGGCSTILPQAAPMTVYRLPQGTLTAAPAATTDEVQLRITTPRATGLLQGSRMLVIPSDNRISIYHGARWNTDIPTLLRDRLVDAFRQLGNQKLVFAEDAGLRADYSLVSRVEHFEADYAGDDVPTVVMVLDAVLVSANGRTVASHRFQARAASESPAVPDVVTAFGKATNKLAASLVAWTGQAINKARAGQASAGSESSSALALGGAARQ